MSNEDYTPVIIKLPNELHKKILLKKIETNKTMHEQIIEVLERAYK